MKNAKILAAAVALSLMLAACGSDDASDAGTDTDAETQSAEGTDSTTAADGAMDDEDGAMDEDAMDDEDDAMAEDAMDEDAMADDDAMDDDDAMADDEDAMAEDDGAMSEDDDAEGGDDTPVAAASQVGSLSFVSIDFTTGEVEVVNNTDAEIDINGWVMCNFPSYAPISGVDPIAPGGTLTLTSTVAVPGDDGELAIYTAEDFTDPAAIVTYVEWGSDGHTRAPVAIEAGVWDGTALASDGNSLTIGG